MKQVVTSFFRNNSGRNSIQICAIMSFPTQNTLTYNDNAITIFLSTNPHYPIRPTTNQNKEKIIYQFDVNIKYK